MDKKTTVTGKKRAKKTKIVAKAELQDYLSNRHCVLVGPDPTQSGKYIVRYAYDWEKWEIRLRRFLTNVGLNNVGGGRSYKIGGHQIDACGGFESTFLVVECKHKDTPGFKSLKDAITLFTGKRAEMESDLLSRYQAQYSQIILILAISEIKVSSRDRDRAKKSGVFLWDEDYVKSYEQIAKDLTGHVQYQILRDLDAKPSQLSEVRVPAFKVAWHNNDIYSFFAEPEDLLRLCYVFRRGTAKDKAYQRGLKHKRLSALGEFIDNGGYFANNLIINVKEKLEWTPLDFARTKRTGLSTPGWLEVGMLTLPGEYCSCQVIDGQHRLYGFSAAKSARDGVQLSVVAFENLDDVAQARLFILINQEQKRVNPNLIWDLYSDIHPHDYLGVISRVAKRLASDPYSPLYGEINIPGVPGGKKRKPIKLANLCKGINDRKLIWGGKNYARINHNLWNAHPQNTEDLAVDLFKTYFRVVSKQLAFDWKMRTKGLFFNNNGINLLLRLLVEIMEDRHPNLPNIRDFRRYISPLASFLRKNRNRIDSARRNCSSEAGRADVALRLMYEISESVPGFAAKAIRRKGPKKIPPF